MAVLVIVLATDGLDEIDERVDVTASVNTCKDM